MSGLPLTPTSFCMRSTMLILLRIGQQWISFERYPVLSSQSFTEVINVCRRKWKYDKSKQIDVGEFLLANSQLIPTNEDVVRVAHRLIVSYDFQYFDSLIVAGALQADCSTLYSEDMHHQLLVEKRLQIINPFF